MLAKKRKNGIFRYHTIEDVIAGHSYTEPEDYDMMEIIILNLGDGEKDTGYDILNLLNLLFSPIIPPKEKKMRLEDEYNIAMTEKFEREVQTMCNLSDGLVEMGVQKGIEETNLALAQMMLQDGEPIEKIQKYTGYSMERLKEIEKNMRE